MKLLESLQSAVEISLWDCLHDGELLAVASDLRTQTATLTVHVPYLCEKQEIAEDVHFLITIQDVQVALAARHHKPFDFEEPVGVTPQVRSSMINDYFKKWRSESMAWTEFESVLPENPMTISHASLLTKAGVVALTAEGSLYGEQYDDVSCEFLHRRVFHQHCT